MNQTHITKDPSRKKIVVQRTFDAPRPRVWAAWTDSALLDQWWAPKPWKAVTHSFDFREGGHWHYYMSGPEGEKHWAWIDYLTINAPENFTGEDAFCDEAGQKSGEISGIHWLNEFHDAGETTDVIVTITFSTEADMEQIIGMGFEEGFSMGLDQLEELLA